MELNRSENILYQKISLSNASIFYNVIRNRLGERICLIAPRFRLNAQINKLGGSLRDALPIMTIYQTLLRRIVFPEYIFKSVSHSKKLRDKIISPLKKFFGRTNGFLTISFSPVDIP